MRGAIVGSAAVLLALSGCGLSRPMATHSRPVPSRSFLIPGELPSSSYPTVGYVLLTSRDLGRSMATCGAFLRNLEMDVAYDEARTPIEKRAPTFWLLDEPLVDDGSITCAPLVTSYDYRRAVGFAQTVGRTESRGPVLVAWQGSGGGVGEALVLDMSNLHVREFDDAFRLWRKHVTDDATCWNGTAWNIGQLKLGFKSFVNEYGESIVSSVSALSRGLFISKDSKPQER